MNANVHTSVGLATSTGLALLVPAMQANDKVTLTLGIGCAVVGALIPDIDANGESKAKKEFRQMTSYLSIFAIATVGYAIMRGSVSELISSLFSSVHGLGALAFLVFCIVGYKSDHRTFTHRLIGLICFTVSFMMMTSFTLGLWFGAGMLSHQVIDMLNKRKITWLYPLPIDFARYICKADSKMSSAIGVVCSGLFLIFTYLIFRG